MHPLPSEHKPNSPVIEAIKRKHVLLISIALFACFYVVMQNCYLKRLYGFHAGSHYCIPYTSEKTSNATSRLPRIMMWTSYFQKWYGTLDDIRNGEVVLRNCNAKCLVTNDPCLAEFSDAVVFHVRDLNISHLPPRRPAWQKWIFYTMEAPPSTEFMDLSRMREVFNWTMTYRSDSDVYVPYGRVVDHRPKPASARTDLKAIWKTKNRTAVWPVSECLSYGGREKLYIELQRYMDVEVYGNCGPYECPQSEGSSCYEHFERTYFFILAFEDSICEDYATDKLFTALKHGIVPVVFGGANYSRIAPRHSYIDALAFESPEKLAHYLAALSQNYTQYAAYFRWKEHQDVVPWDGGFCELCTKLHSGSEVRRTSSYSDVQAWWLEGSRCHVWEFASAEEQNIGPR